MRSDALSRLLALRGEFDATLAGSLSEKLTGDPAVEVVVTMADSRRVTYRLVLSANGDVAYAREASPDKLPGYCPQLHINPDSTFCMGWGGAADLKVTDEESAREWWSRLHGYLRLQHRAKRLRRWPGKEWAHGDAARHQHYAEQHASLLGEDFTRDLEAQNIRVSAWNRLLPSHGRLLRVYRDNTLIYTVSEKLGRVLNTRQKCVCLEGDVKRHRRLRSCSGHAKAAAGLALSIWEWAQAEEKFWAAVQTRKCCGQMDGCHLQL